MQILTFFRQWEPALNTKLERTSAYSMAGNDAHPGAGSGEEGGLAVQLQQAAVRGGMSDWIKAALIVLISALVIFMMPMILFFIGVLIVFALCVLLVWIFLQVLREDD
jgi:hypothetical protein